MRRADDPVAARAVWPKDGICDKESIRTVYDVSCFGSLRSARYRSGSLSRCDA